MFPTMIYKILQKKVLCCVKVNKTFQFAAEFCEIW